MWGQQRMTLPVVKKGSPTCMPGIRPHGTAASYHSPCPMRCQTSRHCHWSAWGSALPHRHHPRPWVCKQCGSWQAQPLRVLSRQDHYLLSAWLCLLHCVCKPSAKAGHQGRSSPTRWRVKPLLLHGVHFVNQQSVVTLMLPFTPPPAVPARPQVSNSMVPNPPPSCALCNSSSPAVEADLPVACANS